jgi:hypothetical protein
MHPKTFARLAVAGVSLLAFGGVALATKNYGLLVLVVPPVAILELFLSRLQ